MGGSKCILFCTHPSEDAKEDAKEPMPFFGQEIASNDVGCLIV
jgi:hypothetical protein